MFCIYCGATVEEGVKACPNCGSELLVLEPPKSLTPQEQVSEDTIQISLLNGEDNGRDIYSSAPHRFREEPEMEDISSGRQLEPTVDEYNMAGNEHDPQNVPYADGYVYEEYDEDYEEEKPKKRRVWPWVLSAVLAVILLVGTGVGIYLWYTSPSQQFSRAVDANDYTQIAQLLPQLEDGERRAVIPQMKSYAAEAVQRYNGGEVEYSEAYALVERLARLFPDVNELQTAKSDMETLKASKDAFAAAVKAEKNGDKVEALRLLQTVIESDADYVTAQEHIAAIRSEYRSEVIRQAEALAAKEDFLGAYAVLEESRTILGDDAEITAKVTELTDAEKENYVVSLLKTAQQLADEQDYIGAVEVLEAASQEDARFTERIESYKGQYREEYLTQAEAYAGVSDYEEAIATLQNAKDFLGEDERLNEKIDEYKKLLPVMLIDLQHTGGTDQSGVSAVTGVNGSTYANGLSFALYPEVAETVATEYTPGGKYKRFSGTWVVESATTNGFIGKIRVYVDGSLQYELSSLTVNSSPADMNLLIDGAESIRIEAEGAFADPRELGYIYLAGAVFRN